MEHHKATNTEAKIKSAFVFLVNHRGLEKLNVKDITMFAHINRSTFYAHYVDKFALIDHYETKIINDIQSIIRENLADTMKYQSPTDPTMQICPIFNQVLDYISHDFDLIKALLSSNGDSNLEIRIKQMLQDVIDTDLFRVKGTTKMTKLIPNSFAKALVVDGIFDIAKVWLAQTDPYPPKTVADVVTKTRFMSPYDLLGIDDKKN